MARKNPYLHAFAVALLAIVAGAPACDDPTSGHDAADTPPETDGGDTPEDALDDTPDVDPDDGAVDTVADAEADGEPDGEVDPEADADSEAEADGDVGDGDVPTEPALVVYASDYLTGTLALIDPETLAVTTDLAVAHSDAMLVCRPGGGFDLVERLGADRLRRFARRGDAVTEEGGHDFPDGSNPQDAVPLAAGGVAVPLYEADRVVLLGADPSIAAGTVDLAPLADPVDDLTEPSRGVEAGGLLWVALQRLDRSGTWWSPTGPGLLAAIDPTGASLIDLDPGEEGVQGIDLPASNPVGPVRYMEMPGVILAGCTGEYGVDDGGIALVDPLGRRSLGLRVGEAALGGDLGDWVIVPGVGGFALVTAAFTMDRIVRVDIDTGTVDPEPLLESAGYTLSGLSALPDGRLSVGDRTSGAEGVRVFDAATGEELTATPIDVGLPPVMSCLSGP